jgi:Domain of unknown function (DUF4278)
MKLTYRGVPYEYNPCPQDMTESQILGKYRYHAWSLRYPRHMNIPQPVTQWQYRGVPYQTTTTGGIQAISKAIPARPKIPQPQISEVTKIHHAYLLKSLQHRIDVAKSKGDTHLVYLLEEESRQLA